MKMIANVAAILLGVVGIVWFFQGIGVIKGSFMSDDITWAIIGLVCIVVAGAVFYFSRRRSTSV